MNRRDVEKLQKLAVAMVAAILLLMLILGATILRAKARAAQLEEEWLAQQQAIEDAPPPEPPDPFSGLSQAATERVRALAVTDATAGATTIGARVDSGALSTRVDALRRPGVTPGAWTARRLGEHSVYEVSFLYEFHAVHFGPRWYVQMNADGPSPDGSGGVVPVNGLAEQLQRPDLDEGLRYLNRADEVLEALTEHRFEGGTRLGSALLVFFQGRGDSAERSVIGWHVVPEKTNPDEELVYRAFFQWQEGEETHDAWWEVNLSNRDFRAKDLQANEIMASGAEVAQDDVIDIRPRTLDLTQPPAEERDARVRALRYLLSNDRLIEAVGTLLSFRGRTTELEYVGWEPNVTDQRHIYDIACMFNEGSEQVRVTWRVDANTGVATPTSDIARTAQLALELVSEGASN